MAAWRLVPALTSLRDEINDLAPGRDKSSDGTIGDTAHSAGGTSDHLPDEDFAALRGKDADSTNEVHAIDVDVDLRKSGWSMNRAVEIVVTRHRTGADDRLQNVIYNRRIWSRSWGWTAREYTGSNPHDKHAHFSSRYTTAQERSTRGWGLLLTAEQEEDDMAMTKAERADLIADIADAVFDKMCTEPVDLPGRVGDRVNALGLDPQSMLGYLGYCYEQLQAQPAGPLLNPDGSKRSNHVQARLARMERNTEPLGSAGP